MKVVSKTDSVWYAATVIIGCLMFAAYLEGVLG